MEISVAGQSCYFYAGNRPTDTSIPTVVFVHGAAMDHTVWLLQSKYFAHHGYNVVAVDLPGHGRSAGLALTSIGAIADWIAAVLDELDVDQALLVGHSMGALAVLDFAGRWPARAIGLALLGVAVPMAVGEGLLDAARENSPAAVDMITIWGFSQTSHLGGSAVPGLWLSGGGKRLLARAGRDVLYTDLAACNDYVDGLQRANAVRCPAALVLGQQDLMTPPRKTEELAGALRDVRTTVLPFCGHMMTTELPDRTLDALLELARSVAPV